MISSYIIRSLRNRFTEHRRVIRILKSEKLLEESPCKIWIKQLKINITIHATTRRIDHAATQQAESMMIGRKDLHTRFEVFSRHQPAVS